jgi:3-oxoadipate enol-lactonase
MFVGCSSAGYVGASCAVRDADFRGELHAIAAPTLVLSGANDLVTPSADGRALHAAIPGAMFREVPGAHLSNIEEPATYNEVLLAFLQQQITSEALLARRSNER